MAVLLFTMPVGLAMRAAVLGAITGFFPIGWIILNVTFLYRLTVEKEALACLVGCLVMLQAYVRPFSALVLH